MFEKVFEKRDTDVASKDYPIDWTKVLVGSDSNSFNDETYTRCLNLLGDTVGKLSLEVRQETDKGNEVLKNHPLYELLRLRPNQEMNAFDVYGTLIRLLKHYGIAGLYINRGAYSGKVEGLYPVRIDGFIIDDLINSKAENKVLINFTCINTPGSCFSKDMIILRDMSLDGINSKSIKRSIKKTILSNIKANDYQLDLFSNGLTNKAVVQLMSDIKDENELKKLQDKFNRIYGSKGRIFTVPAGYNVQALNLSLADSQFSELKVLGKKGISSAMGVPYSFIDEMKGITDEDIMSFITITIFPILVQIEEEADWKLLSANERKNDIKIRFNINGLLRTTPKIQQEIICEYTKQGIYSLNYARKLADAPLLDKDVTVFPSGQVTLEQLVSGRVSYIKNSLKGGDNDA